MRTTESVLFRSLNRALFSFCVIFYEKCLGLVPLEDVCLEDSVGVSVWEHSVRRHDVSGTYGFRQNVIEPRGSSLTDRENRMNDSTLGADTAVAMSCAGLFTFVRR